MELMKTMSGPINPVSGMTWSPTERTSKSIPASQRRRELSAFLKMQLTMMGPFIRWADDDSNLPNNYFSALVELKSLNCRLEKDPI